MFDGKKLFSKISNTVNKVIDEAQQTMGGVYQNQADKTAEQNTDYSMYEVFTPAMGMGKKFVITEKSIIFGSEEFTYSQLSPICIVNPPMRMSNGTASTTANGKALVLAYDFSQKDRFTKAMIYANEQIDLAHGTVRTYKFMLQSEQGTKLEVYDDYLILYELKTGFTKIVGNSMQGGSGGMVLHFSGIDILLSESEGQVSLAISSHGETHYVELNNEQKEIARAIIEYVASFEETKAEQEQEEFVSEEWEQVKGEEKTFTLNGVTLTVPSEMDTFNTYRLKYFDLATKCTEKAKAEYLKRVQNLSTYLEFFPIIYEKYLNILIKQSMEVLVSEGIWTVTEDSFLSEHLEEFHRAIDEYYVTVESVQLTVEANQNKISSVMSFIPNLSGGGFGLKGAAKGIATATAFNLIRDGAESGLLKGASQINQAQQIELYQRINPDALFEFVLQDYWRVFLTLGVTLINNGYEMWWPDEELTQRASNVFKNLSNPRFPQDKLLDVFIEILEIHPYTIDYHKFMVSKFGDNEETRAIRNYFGYTDLNNSKMG